MFLAVASIFAGYIPFSKFVTSDGLPLEAHIEWIVAIPSIIVGFIGIAIAFVLYKKETTIPNKIGSAFKLFYVGAYNKFYFDEIYLFVTKK